MAKSSEGMEGSVFRRSKSELAFFSDQSTVMRVFACFLAAEFREGLTASG